MAPRTTIAALLAASGFAAAQNATALSGPGPYPEGQDFLEDAQVTAEKTVSSDLFQSNDGNAARWQLVTRSKEAAPPDSQIPNAQVLNTVYDIGFLNGGKLNIEENGSDGSCACPLHDQCLEAISNRVAETEAGDDGCGMTNVTLDDIVQCEWIFDQNARISTHDLLSPEIAGSLTGGFAHITSDPYDGNNQSFVDIAETRIRMVVIREALSRRYALKSKRKEIRSLVSARA